METVERNTPCLDEKLNEALEEIDDDADDADDADGDVVKEGLAGVGSEKDKKTKPRWLALVNGTLYWYKGQCLTNQKGELELRNASVSLAEATVTVKSLEKSALLLVFNDPLLASDWADALKSATALAPGQALKGARHTKHTKMTTRVNKAVVGKVAGSGVGKSLAKTSLNEESKLLISSVKNLISLAYDSKTASLVESNIIKIFVKYHYLMEDGQLEEDSWTAMDQGLREAFKWGVKIADNTQSGRHIPKTTLAEWIGNITVALRNVEMALAELLQPFVQAKTLNRIAQCFNILASHQFLMAVFDPESANKIQVSDSDALTYAMERYLQFSW